MLWRLARKSFERQKDPTQEAVSIRQQGRVQEQRTIFDRGKEQGSQSKDNNQTSASGVRDSSLRRSVKLNKGGFFLLFCENSRL